MKAPFKSRSSSPAFTLVELLVVIAVIAVLIALLLPAVQKVRESANKTACSNNMKQICLSVLSFESANNYLPPGTVNDSSTSLTPYPNGARGCHPFLLPYVEQLQVYQLFDFGKTGGSKMHWNNDVNKPAYQSRIAVFICPSVPGVRSYSGTDHSIAYTDAALTDYHVLNGVRYGNNTAQGNGFVSFTYTQETARGVLATPLAGSPKAKLRQVKDGTSNTLMFTERAGAPTVYLYGKAQTSSLTDGAWAQDGSNFNIAGLDASGNSGGSCAINCTNRNEIYSFHMGGAYMGFADGSVRFADQNMDIKYVYALVTRAAEDTIPPEGLN